MILRVFGSIIGFLTVALLIIGATEEQPKRQGSICIKETTHKVICYCGETLCGESGVMP